MDLSVYYDFIIVCSSLCVCSLLLAWLRYKIPKNVQCWFCHEKVEVLYESRNAWFCPSCDQYNGFKEDGSYNKVIENQYSSLLNPKVIRKESNFKTCKSLCDTCNFKQEAKVKLLADFVPINNRNYDSEIEHYKNQLEKWCKLCKNCKQLLHDVFKAERSKFAVPRTISTAIKKVHSLVTVFLISNILLAVIFSLATYNELKNWPESVNGIAKEVFKIIDTYTDHFQTHLVAISLFINITAAFANSIFLPNCIFWFVNLILAFNREFIPSTHYFMIFVSIVICFWNLGQLTKTTTKKGKATKLKIRNVADLDNQFDAKKMYDPKPRVPAPSFTSTPRGSPSQSFVNHDTFDNFGEKIRNVDHLEPKIRQLNLGDSSFRMKDLSENWWNGSTYNVSRAPTEISINTTLRKRGNILSPSKFDDLSQKSSSSGISSLYSNRMPLEDDCVSCVSSCRHYNPPPAVPYYFLPSPQFHPNLYQQPVYNKQTKNNLFYILPFSVLVICNAALMYTSYKGALPHS